ncbi:MAG: EamA family transporter [Nitriliruptorales bacterium]|nr:EamA family transporter [Nitriliruptorales bacterium]
MNYKYSRLYFSPVAPLECVTLCSRCKQMNRGERGGMAAALALTSALSFGAADFLGGLAARRCSALTVTGVSQLAGLMVLVPALLVFDGVLSMAAIWTGALAGLAGAGGLVLYLRSLAIGPMSLVAPVAAVVGAALPVAAGVVAGERPPRLALAGVAIGLAAVWLATGQGRRRNSAHAHAQGPLLALLAGLAFGAFFIFLDATPADSGAWPLVAARGASLIVLTVAATSLRRPLPSRKILPVAAVSGGLDMAANLLFLAATRTGLLTLTALLASLYPVVVVLLAWRLMAERLTRAQLLGVVMALAAVGLIAAAP